jgi:hypothetical protein
VRYVNQNSDLFAMTVEHFHVKWDDIDYVDRSNRAVWLHDGSRLDMPDEWVVT